MGISGAEQVAAFMRDLSHPRKAEFEAVREIILQAHPGITEGIKWNAPSFRFGDDFATFNLRKDYVLLVFHRGAKVKKGPMNLTIEDPEGLLEWLGTDRAVVKFRDMESVQAHRGALEEIVRQWITHLSR